MWVITRVGPGVLLLGETQIEQVVRTGAGVLLLVLPAVVRGPARLPVRYVVLARQDHCGLGVHHQGAIVVGMDTQNLIVDLGC